MMDLIFNNIGSVMVSVVLLLIVVLIIRKLFNDKKRGISSCGCNCKGCALAGSCHGNCKLSGNDKTDNGGKA